MGVMFYRSQNFNADLCSWDLAALQNALLAFFRTSKEGFCDCQAQPGHYCYQGRTTQDGITCPAGSFNDAEGRSSCDRCPAGTFQDERGATGCEPCKPGRYCPTGSSAPLFCVEGTYSIAKNLEAVDQCTACPIGFACSPGSTEPVPCLAGTFAESNRSSLCEPCPAGTFQDGERATGCKPCTPGKYCLEGTRNPLLCPEGRRSNESKVMESADDCIVCSAGTFCPTGSAEETECAPGTYSNATEAASCSKCPGGTFQDEEGALACKPCIAGSFCPEGASAAQVCLAGSYSDATNLSASSGCTVCPVGHACGAGSTGPTACAAGTFTNETGQGACWPCAAGSFQRVSGATECDICDVGYYCLEGASAPLPCPEGRRSNASKVMESADDCIVCSAGTFCPTGSKEETECAPGTYSNATEAASCSKCPGGTFQDEERALACKPCIAGSFCPEGASAALVCSGGRFSNATDLMSDEDCLPCPQGHACAPGSTAPSPCLAGSFAASEGSQLCELCEAGFYQEASGQANCTRCSAGFLCPVGASLELPAACTPGTFADVTDADGDPDCFECPAGSFCPGGAAAPTPCSPGSFVASEGLESCHACPAGKYQSATNATGCVDCKPGSYCTEGSSAPLPCPAGRRTNPDLEVMMKAEDCVECSAGTFCATGSDEETPCAPGTYSEDAGASSCDKCLAGSYSEAGVTACTACELGKYAANDGQGLCVQVPCPFPLSSKSSRSVSCFVCKEDFFLNNATADPEEVFIKPDTYCTKCPPTVQCGSNVSLETLPIPAGSWRDGTASSRIYDCFVSESGYSPCSGSSRRSDVDSESDGDYCALGHRGPLCQVCVEPTQFYGTYSGRCLECSKSSKLGRFFGALMGTVTLLIFLFIASKKVVAFRKLIHRVASVAGTVGPLPKAKILVSFYQVFNTLGDVYGVRLHRHFTGWLDFVAVFDAPAAEFMLPGTCVGSMQARLALNSLWPVAVVGVVVACIGAFGVVQRLYSSDYRSRGTWVTRDRVGNATLFILFLVLPNVSRSIFSARQCVSFEASDAEGTSNSYLLADMDISCTSSEFSRLNSYFWTFFVLWPLSVPLMGLALMLSIQKSIRAQHYSNLANACRFLWRDYETTFLYWEIVDMLRKILLTALILFVDTQSGEVRLLRLWLAAFVSAGYLALLGLARPFKRAEDLFLSCTSNLLLTSCFLSGIAIKLCEDQAWANTCTDFLGLDGSYQANVFVVVITVAMLVLSLGVIVVKTVLTVSTGTIRVVATGRDPVLELPEGCIFHCFLSHAWRTGQDQTHTMARQLQLLLPQIKIWLDVDNLIDVGKLEEAVSECAVFTIFLSQGYFRSANCRRELYAALKAEKPIVVVREDDRDKGGASVQDLMKECRECCREQAEQVFECVFAEEPIVWVQVRDFQIESLKLIAFRMLLHLPYYRNNAEELEPGLKLAGELGPCVLEHSVVLLVCKENAGARRVAEEIQSAEGEAAVGTPPISIRSADLVLNQPPDNTLKTMLMLYLTDQTFLDADNSVSKLVKDALDRKIPIIPVHEQDAEAGGCAFGEIFDRTPDELLRPPYSLWDTLAIPLYPAAEHRKISIRHVLRGMGARPARKAHSSSSQATHAGAKRSTTGSSKQTTNGRTDEGQSDPPSFSQTSDWQAPAQLTNGLALGAAQPYAGAYHPQCHPQNQALSPGVLVHPQTSWHWNAQWQVPGVASSTWLPMSYLPSWEGARP